MKGDGRLVVVSNRVPSLASPATEEEERAQPVGGLVSSLRSAVERRGGLWFGWSGRSVERMPDTPPDVSDVGAFQLATLDLSEDESNLFYSVFANRTLWPLLHSFPAHVVIRHDAYRTYRRVNRRFAQALSHLLEEGDLVWVHDYHLFLLGHELRTLGWEGRVGFFLHTPFPSAEIFAILPWDRRLLEGLMAYDLVGFHTARYAHNFLDTLATALDGFTEDNVFTHEERSVRVAAYPIGTDPTLFQQWARQARYPSADQALQRISPGQRIVLGVDRLDYTKGIPARLLAFERLLERHPSLRGRVTMIQISAPSRSRLPEYVEEKNRVDQLVGRINGRFSEAGWAPVHYLYRSYTQAELARFLQEAEVCLVTPLRDGMNLIAKEFVASQGDDPGVLILSKFCGAAETMTEALIVNPYDIEGTAEAIYQAVDMSARERRRRWEALNQEVITHTAQTWSDTFLADLAGPQPVDGGVGGPSSRRRETP